MLVQETMHQSKLLTESTFEGRAMSRQHYQYHIPKWNANARAEPAASEGSHLTGAPAAPLSALSTPQTHSSHNCQTPANHFNAIMGEKR